MKSILLSFLFFVGSISALAAGLTAADLVGTYSLTGNGGFLSYELKFNEDGSANLSQRTIDGSEIVCQGVYNLDNSTQDFVSVYHCQAGEVLTQETSLAGVTRQGLLRGVSLPIHIKSNLGSDSTVQMFLKKK